MQIARPVLIDTHKQSDVVHLTIMKESYFRVYVPPHPEVDITLLLVRADWTTVASAHALTEETIFERLSPGRYLFAANYTAPSADKVGLLGINRMVFFFFSFLHFQMTILESFHTLNMTKRFLLFEQFCFRLCRSLTIALQFRF
jgi:hypothetical protein